MISQIQMPKYFIENTVKFWKYLFSNLRPLLQFSAKFIFWIDFFLSPLTKNLRLECIFIHPLMAKFFALLISVPELVYLFKSTMHCPFCFKCEVPFLDIQNVLPFFMLLLFIKVLWWKNLWFYFLKLNVWMFFFSA